MQQELLLGKTRSEIVHLSKKMDFKYITRRIDEVVDPEDNKKIETTFEEIDPEDQSTIYKIWFKGARVVAVST